MGKVISDEDVKLNVIINGNDAQKDLGDLEKSTRKLNEANVELRREKARLEKQGRQESERYKELTREINANNKQIRLNKDEMSRLQKEIGITGLTMKQLTDRANVLRMSLKNAVPGGEAYQKYKAELGQISGRLDELSGKGKHAKLTMSSLADGFNKYAALGGSVLAVLTGFVFSIQKIIDINGKLADAQSDVRKTTGMTAEEVDELSKSFGLLHTRTSRINLLKIAEQGGRIGILKEDIGDFVAVMDKASVALGDSFTGGAEEVATKLGKIKFLFEETKALGVDKAYNSIGSAINDLGANGSASEANIAEFTTRMGSLTDVLKPTVQETLALGAAFEESGIEAEVSARAYNIFMKQASTESGKFAEVLGVSKKKIEEMINTNPLDFMMKFAQSMKGMDATKTAQTLDYLGVNADGANKVLGAMGNNMERFRELIDLSNKSFSDGTSLINEYNIKNKNLAATYEKISKKVAGWFSSESANTFLANSFEWFAKFIGATEDADGSVSKWRNTLVFAAKIVAVLTAALITNAAWQKLVAMVTKNNTELTILNTVATKARAFAEGASMVASQAYAAVTMLLTGNVKGATQALRVMTATMKTTPWGFILSAVVAIGAAYIAFSKQADTATKKQKLLADLQYETANGIYKEKNELEALLKVAKNEFESKENRLAAIKRLNAISPEYLGNLTLENIATKEGQEMTDKYIESLKRLAYTKALQNKMQKLQDEKADIQTTSDDDVATTKDQINAYGDKALDFLPGVYGGRGKDSLKRRAKATRDLLLKEKEAEMKMLQDLIDADIKKNAKNYINTGEPEFTAHAVDPDKKGKGKKDPNSSEEEILKLRLESVKKFLDSIEGMERKSQDERIAAMEDGYEKEMAIEDLRYQREIEDLEKQKIHTDEFVKLDADRAKAKADGDIRLYNHLTQQKEVWAQRNLAIDEKIDDLEISALALHKKKLSVIEEKAATEEIKKDRENYEQGKIDRETKFNEELAALGQNYAKIRSLKRKFEKQEMIEEEKFLKKLFAKLKAIAGKGGLGKIDLSLLTPEQTAEFEKEAAKVGLSLSQLIEKKKELQRGENAEGAAALGLGQAADTDILGFSLANWEQFFTNLEEGKFGVNEMAFAVQALMGMWSKYNEYVEANENARLQQFEQGTEKRKKKLDNQLKAGIISQEQHDKVVDVLNRQVEKKKADLEYKQAKRKKAMAIVETIVNTSVAIMQAYAQMGPIAGTIAAVLIGTMGALQINAIRKQPLPAKGYEKGLYGDYVRREQDGKVFKSSYGGKTKSGIVSKPTHFLTGENGPEMVIDAKAWSRIPPSVQQMFINEIRTAKGFEQGYYKDGVLNTGPTDTNPKNNDGPSDRTLLEYALQIIAENTKAINDLAENGVIGHFSDRDEKSLDKLRKGINRVQERYEKNKH